MESVKESIKQQLRIEQIIGSYVTLVPLGNNFKACCPFHHEKTPSFNINTDKQMFYCFGCKKGGDIFSFVQEIEKVDFRESLKILAEKAGISLQNNPEMTRELQQKKVLYEIHEYANRFYQICLSKDGQVIKYLLDRGITKETIKKWRIGFVPDGFSHLVSVLKRKGFSDQDLIASGLVIKGDKGVYDRFRGRIMFPITDHSGKVIGFSARIMPGTKESERDNVGKYINSPETILYHKSKILFGFSFAKQSLSEKKSVILVEGQFDAILVSQQGFENVVAISGTAGTEQHIEQLARFVTEIIIATDSDYAGLQSAKKIAEFAYQFDRDVSIIEIPKNADPADIIRNNPEGWNQLVEQRKDFIQFYIDHTQDEESQKKRIQSIQEYLFPLIAKLPNAMYQDAQLQKIAYALSVSSESIRLEFNKILNQQSFIQETKTTQVIEKKPVKDVFLYSLQEMKRVHHYCNEAKFWFEKNPETVDLIQEIILDDGESFLAEQLIRYSGFDQGVWEKYLDSLWIGIQQIQIDRELQELRKQISSQYEVENIQELQQKLLQLRTKREELTRRLLST